MTLQDVYEDLLSARRKLDAYDFCGKDTPFVQFVRKAINRALHDLDRRFVVELALR